jgi:hypothetical protein
MLFLIALLGVLPDQQFEELLETEPLEPKAIPPPLEWRPQQQMNAPNYSV